MFSRPRFARTAALALAAVLAATSAAAAQDKVEPNDFAPQQEKPVEAKPASPQPAADALAPGLAVAYWYTMVRDIKEVQQMVGRRDPKPGKPLAMLDYKVGQGKVLTADDTDGVCAQITGFIRFEQPGEYVFVANSNDGMFMEISGEMVVEDPNVHADRYTAAGTVIVKEPGWYAFHMLYFERKNEATLQLFWKTPGASDYVLVPASVFAHKKA